MNTHSVGDPSVHPYRWLNLAALSFSILVISLDNTILNVALPTLARDLSATTSQLQWMVDAYTLVYAGLLLTAGSLGDRFGRKRALLVGMLVFGLGSVWAAVSGSANLLIAARALMGVGGALMMPSTLSITANIFPAKERATAIGVLTGVGAMGIVIGPLLGGWLLEHFSWGTIFLINAPVILVTLLATLLLVPESKDPQASRLDPIGALLSISGLMALLYGIIEVPAYGLANSSIVVAFVAAPILLVAFVIWELRSRFPMLDVKLFSNPRFSAASIALTLTSFALVGVLFFLTQYLQLVLGYTPFQAGLSFIPLVITLMLSAGLSPRLVQLFSTKAIITVGLMVVAGGITLLALATMSTGYPLVIVVLLVLGLGLGMTMVPATNSIMGVLPLSRAGVGSAVNDTTQEVGGALGVAILGSVLAWAYHTAMDVAPALQSLPPQVKDAVRDSIGKASVIAMQLGGPTGHAIIHAANAAFIEAMNHTVLVAAVVSFCGALVALVFLPARELDVAFSLTEQESVATIEQQEETTPIS